MTHKKPLALAIRGLILGMGVLCVSTTFAAIQDVNDIATKSAGDRFLFSEFNKIVEVLQNFWHDDSTDDVGMGEVTNPSGGVCTTGYTFRDLDNDSTIDNGECFRGVTVKDGDTGLGTISPSSFVDIEKAGTAKANLDILELTNPVNAADMDGTETSVLFNQYYYDASTPAVADSGRISIGTEQDWTSTGSTQDSYMAFETAVDGTVTEQVRIDSSGNMGVGTVSPSEKLHVDAGTWEYLFTDGIINLKHSNANVYGKSGIVDTSTYGLDSYFGYPLVLRTGTSSTANERVRISSSGKVGIGTNSPDRLLHTEISDSGTNTVTYGQRLSHVTSGTPAANIGVGIEFEQETSVSNNEVLATIEGIATTVTSTAEDGALVFKTMTDGAAATEKLRIDSDGNVKLTNNSWVQATDNAGTGTINLFKVNSSDAIELGGSLQVDGGFAFPEDSGAIRHTDMSVSSSASDGDEMSYAFQVDGETIMEVSALADGSGGVDTKRVGINNSTPTSSLDVTGTVTATAFSGDGSALTDLAAASIVADTLDWDKFDDTMVIDATTTFDLDTNTADLNFDSGTLYIDDSGYVGIGTTSPTTPLTIANDSWISARNNAGTGVVNMFKLSSSDFIEVGGPLYFPGGLGFPEDSGVVTAMDMSVSSSASDNTVESYAFQIDGENVLKVSAQADGSGGIDTKQVEVTGDLTVSGTTTLGGAITIDATDINVDTIAEKTTDAGVVIDGLTIKDSGIAESLTLTAADPALILDGSTTTDTDFWLGVTADEGGDDDDVFQIGDGTTAGTNPFVTVDTAGQVGIGVASPATKLDILGTEIASGVFTGTTPGIIRVGGGVFNPDDVVALDFGSSSQGSGTAPLARIGAELSSTGSYLKFGTSNSYGSGVTNMAMSIDPAGNVGIGTASPSSLFDLEKSGTVKANTDILEITNSVNTADMDGTETSVLFNQYYYDASTPAVADSGRISIGTEQDWTSTGTTQDSYMAFETALNGTVTEQVRITSDGDVGIGTDSPTTPLHVVGNTYISGKVTTGDSFVSALFGSYGVIDNYVKIDAYDGQDVLLQTRGDGNVGIGTTSPTNALDVIAGTSNTPLGLYRDTNTVGWGTGIKLYLKNSADSYVYYSDIYGGIANNTAGSEEGTLVFRTKNSGVIEEQMKITSDGIGIGTASPNRLLHAEVSDSATNTVTYGQRLSHITSGTPAAGIGTGIEFEQETTADNNEVIAAIEAVTTDITATSEDGDIIFKNMAAGAAAAETFRITSDGWLAKSTAKMFKVNSSNEVDIGSTLNIGTLKLASDSGVVNLVNMPVSSTPTSGDDESYSFSIDNNPIMTVFSEADGSGGIQNERVGIGTISPSANLNVYQASPTANQTLLQVGTSDNASRFTVDEDGDVTVGGNLNVSGTSTLGNVEFDLTTITVDPSMAATEGSPSVAFGDGNSGIYEASEDILFISLSGGDKYGFYPNYIRSDSSEGFYLQKAGGSATDPVYSWSVDDDSGIGRAGADQVSITAGAKEIARAKEDTTEQFIINPQGDLTGTAAAPSLAFGDGNTGFYESADNTLVIARDSSAVWEFDGNGFSRLGGNGPRLVSTTPSATGASILPNKADINTGLGRAREDQFSLISGGVEGLRISEGNGEVSSIFGGNVVETITDGSTTGSAATLTKAGENFSSTVSVGDAVVVYGGTTSADYGTYIVDTVTSDTVLTLDRTFGTTNTDVDFDVIADSVVIENSTNSAVARMITNNGTAAAPSLAFGDGNTGLYKTADNELNISLGGASKYRFRTGDFQGVNGTGYFWIRNVGSDATTPLYTFTNDTDTGIGRTTADQVSITAGAKEIARASEDTTEQFIINPQGDLTGTAAAPSLAFGDANTGFYESADNSITVSTDGTARMLFTTGALSAFAGGTSASILYTPSSATVPAYRFGGDTNTGIGSAGADQLSLTAGAIEGVRVNTAASGVNYLDVTPSATTEDVQIATAGTDTNISLKLAPKGTGRVKLNNDSWLAGIDNATTSFVNMFKVNSSDQIDVGGTLNIGTIELTEDSGLVTLVNMPVSATPTDGTEESYYFSIDSDPIMGIKASADSSGGVDEKQVIISPTLQNNDDVPSLAFGDGDTGFFESSDDTLSIAINTSTEMQFNSFGLRSFNGGGYFLNEAATSTNPIFSPGNGDLDTGIGSAGADQLSLVAGGKEGVRINTASSAVNYLDVTPSATGSDVIIATGGTDSNVDLNLAPKGTGKVLVSGDLEVTGSTTLGSVAFDLTSINVDPSSVKNAADPAISFGDGDTGFYESSNVISISINESEEWAIANNAFYDPNYTGGAQLRAETGSATNPTHVFTSDEDTGLGRAGTDQVSLIAGAIEGIRVNTASSGVNYLDVTPSATGSAVQIATAGTDTNVDLKLAPKGTGNVQLTNDTWLSSLDNAGTGTVNMFKVNASDEIEVGGALSLPSGISFVEDSGTVTIADMPVSATPADGTEESYTFKIDGDNVLKVKGSSDGAGGVDEKQVVVSPGVVANNDDFPSLAFGDGNTGFYESIDNTLNLSIAGTTKTTFHADYVRGGNITGSYELNNSAGTATDPTYRIRADVDTGIGYAGADQLSITAGAKEIARAKEATTEQFIINPQADYTGTAAAPNLAFGDGDTGFYESSDDNLRVAIGTSSRYIFTTDSFTSLGAGGFALDYLASSATDPNIIPDRSDTDTGIGTAGADQVSIIAGAEEGIRVNAASGTGVNYLDVTPSATTAAVQIATAGTDTNVDLKFAPKGTGSVQFTNDTWLTGIDNAGTGTVNMFKVNASDEIEVGGQLNIGTMELAEDSGVVTLANMPVSSSTSDGDEMSASFSIDSNPVAKFKASSDGAGGIDETQFIVSPGVVANDSSYPSLAFGDGNTGFYEYSDNDLAVSINGTQYWVMTDTFFGSASSGGRLISTTSATSPSFRPNASDADTGIGAAAADQVSIIAGGLEMLRLVETGTSTTDQLIIAPAGVIGAAATPSLAWGDGDSGFYESADDAMGLSLGGTLKVSISSEGNMGYAIETGATTTGAIAIDLDGGAVQTIALTGDVSSMATSNRSATISKAVTILFDANGADRTFTSFNASWKWLGTAPSSLATGDKGILTLTSFGSAETDVVAAYEELN